MSRCVTCAIVSVVAWVSLKRGGSGLCGMRQLALRNVAVMIEPLLASKNFCNLADVLKYPPSMYCFLCSTLLTQRTPFLKQFASLQVLKFSATVGSFRSFFKTAGSKEIIELLLKQSYGGMWF